MAGRTQLRCVPLKIYLRLPWWPTDVARTLSARNVSELERADKRPLEVPTSLTADDYSIGYVLRTERYRDASYGGISVTEHIKDLETIARSKSPVQLAAQPGTLNAFYLEADTRLPAAGRWTIEVAVSGPDGAGSASFDVDVLPARGINRWLIFGGLGLFLAVLVAIGLWARWPDATEDAATSAPSQRRGAAHKSRR